MTPCELWNQTLNDVVHKVPGIIDIHVSKDSKGSGESCAVTGRICLSNTRGNKTRETMYQVLDLLKRWFDFIDSGWTLGWPMQVAELRVATNNVSVVVHILEILHDIVDQLLIRFVRKLLFMEGADWRYSNQLNNVQSDLFQQILHGAFAYSSRIGS